MSKSLSISVHVRELHSCMIVYSYLKLSFESILLSVAGNSIEG
ncbi:hypothetical protein [Lysinibacillus sphaericus]|nr:hypothetical protein [Lysinibacillus sphaericus]